MSALTSVQLAQLASGYGGDEALELLRSGQVGRRKALLKAVARAATGEPTTAAAFELLLRVEGSAPEAITAIVGYPTLPPFAERWLKGLPDPAYLGALAAAAAIRAGVSFSLAIAVTGNDLHLPTLGSAVAVGPGPAEVVSDGRTVNIRGSRREVLVDGPGWSPACRVEVCSGDLSTVVVVDVDPYGGYDRLEVVDPRLADIGELIRLFSAATEWLGEHRPDHLRGLAVLLQSVVPLKPGPHGRLVSATDRKQLGAIALSTPSDARMLALLLVHELQHTKLGAIYDLVDLHAADPTPRYRAPWRLDPRPVDQLLQGAYAHLGVADVWRARRWESAEAAFEFVYWLEQTRRAVEELRRAELTTLGKAFIEGMAVSMAAWEAECATDDVGSAGATAAEAIANAMAVRWNLQNLVPAASEVNRLAALFRAGELPTDKEAAAVVRWRDQQPVARSTTGLEAAIRAAVVGAPVDRSSLQPEDTAYLAGDYAAAIWAYERRLQGDLDDSDAWVGLALCATRHGPPAAGHELVHHPHVVRALCEVVSDASVAGVVKWLYSNAGSM